MLYTHSDGELCQHWMIQIDAYRSHKVGSVVFYPLELVRHNVVSGSQIGES